MSQMKQQEKKLEQDFNKLMDRYNKSKQLIDQLYGGQTSQPVPLKSDTKPDSNKSKPTKQEKEEPFTAIEPKKYEKYDTYKKQNTKDLKISQPDFRLPSADGQDSKEHIIKQQEAELADTQANLIRAMHEIKEYSIREDSYKRHLEELIDEVEMLKTRQLRKKQKIKQLKEFKHRDGLQMDEQGQIFQNELQRVQNLCQDFSLEIKEADKRNIILKDENSLLREELKVTQSKSRAIEQHLNEYKQSEQSLHNSLEGEREENRLLCMKIEQLEKKNDELKDIVQLSEAKQQKQRDKFENERNTLLNNNDEKLKAKKNKIKQLRDQVSDLEIKNLNQEKDNGRLRKLTDEFDAEILKLRQILSNSKHDYEGLLRENSLQYDKQRQLEVDYDLLKKQLYQADEKLRYELDYKLQEHKHNQSLQQEVEDLSQDNIRLKQIVNELENQVDLMRRQENEEMGHIEQKIDGLVKEIQLLRDENTELRGKANDHKKVIQAQEEKSNALKAKYIKSKQASKQYEHQLKYIEEKVKLYENERHIEEREIQILKQQQQIQKTTQQSKVKILDEIQNMIRQHRKNLSD